MKNVIFIFSLLVLLYSCNDNDDDSIPDLPKNPTIVNLVFPYENSLCNEGTNITTTESTVLFEWEASENTNTYELNLTNSTTGATLTHQTSNTKLSINLQRATPYAWYIISKSNTVTKTAQSAIWNFYNAGEGINAYAPFPAEIISPIMAESITTTDTVISLDWTGNDIDNDITGYDVYFGTTTTPDIFKSNIEESVLNNVPISSNTIYYWKIITKDSRGNISDSGVYQFKIL